MALADQRKRLEAVAGLGDDPDVRLRVQQRAHALTLDGVVVHEQDADLVRVRRPQVTHPSHGP